MMPSPAGERQMLPRQMNNTVCLPFFIIILVLIILFHEYEVHGGYQADEGCEVIPVQALSLEEDVGDDGEDDERHALLYHLQLYQGEGTAVIHKTDAIGWHLTAIFEKGNGPTEGDHPDERPVAAYASLLEFEMSVPSDGHEDVA